jgi:hypothetical protein
LLQPWANFRSAFSAFQFAVIRVVRVRNFAPLHLSDFALKLFVLTSHRVDYLLTWNCRHLANPHLLRRLREFMARRALTLPEVCTPIELAAE